MGRAPRPRPSRDSHRCTRTRKAARRPRASRGSLQSLEHFASFGLDVHLEHLRGLHNHHQPVVVGRDVPSHLDRLGHEDVREFVPHDVGRHRFLRGGDACVECLVQERLGEFAVEDRRHGAGAVVQDRLHAQVWFAFDLAVEPARAFPQDPSALRAPVDEARAFPQVDQDPSHGDVRGATAFREILNPHARARTQHVRGGKQVRLETRDRRALVKADLRDAPPRLDVGALDPEDLFGLQLKVLPGAELGLAGLIGEDAGEDRFRVAVDLDLPPFDGEDSGRDRDVRGSFPQVHHADRCRFADVRLARSGLEFGERIGGFFPDRRTHAEVHLDLAAVLLRVRVLDSDHIALGQRHRERLPRREGHGRGRIAQDAGQDRLRLLPLGGHLLLVHRHDAGEEVHALLPGDQFPNRLSQHDRLGRGVPAALLHDRPFRGIQGHPVDVQVARQLSLDLLLAHFVSERPVDVMDMGRQFFSHRSHVPEACLFLASIICMGPWYKGGRRGGRKYRAYKAARFIPPAPFERAVDTDELLRAIIEFLRIWREQAASRVPTSWGTIYRDERFAAIHQANLGWVASIPEEGSAKILADLDEAFRDSPVRHRSLLFEDAEKAYGVQEDMARQGFRPVADLAMAKVGLPACIVNPDVEIRRAEDGAGADDFRVLKIAADAALGYTPQVVGELWGVWHDRSGRVGMRPYVAYLNGTPAGTISVWARAPFAWVVDVETHPDFRLRGIAPTMTFEACLRAASCPCDE